MDEKAAAAVPSVAAEDPTGPTVESGQGTKVDDVSVALRGNDEETNRG